MNFDHEAMAAVLANLYDGVYFVDEYNRIVYWSKGAEQISGFTEQEMIGSFCRDGISHLDENGACACVDSCQIKRSLTTRTIQEQDLFIAHKDGHRVLVIARTVPTFDNNGNPTGAIQIFREKYTSETTKNRLVELQKQALVDELTQLPNRRSLESSIEMKLEELSRYERPFGIMFIDVDHFKAINDTHGHEVGDKALKLVASTLMNSVRPFDIMGRLGGEEFVGILVNVDEKELTRIVNRARLLVEQSVLVIENGVIEITVSIGATLAEPEETMSDLLKRADTLMYQSKEAGRNRVSIIGKQIVDIES